MPVIKKSPCTPSCPSCGSGCTSETGVCHDCGCVSQSTASIPSQVAATGAGYSSIVQEGGSPTTHDYAMGFNWVNFSFPILCRTPATEDASSESSGAMDVVVIFSMDRVFFFRKVGRSKYQAKYNVDARLTFKGHPTCQFTFADCSGVSWIFDEDGRFLRSEGRKNQTRKATYGDNGKIKQQTRTVAQDGTTYKDHLEYEYDGNDRIVSIISKRRHSGATVNLRRLRYTYYSDGDSYGNEGDLQSVIVDLPSGTGWVQDEVSYYRYYKPGAGLGFKHGMQFALGPEAFRRLALVADPYTASAGILASYADFYYEYDSSQRGTKAVINGGLYTYHYAYNESSNDPEYNSWQLQTVVTRPDGSTETVYSNYLSQVMLRDIADGSGGRWYEYFQYDDQGNEVLHASPEAVSGYSTLSPDLAVTFTGGGLINLTQYYPDTTATMFAPGGVKNQVSVRAVQQGPSGTPIPLSQTLYYVRKIVLSRLYPVGRETVYPTLNPSDAYSTNHNYTWFDGSTQAKQHMITLPRVLTTQNGSGVSAVRRELYDNLGNLTAGQDERGYITAYEYFRPTGAQMQMVQDDSPPWNSGWFANPGPRLRLTSDYESDALGRQTQSQGPSHLVDGSSVRTAVWTVYDDEQHTTRIGNGFATGMGATLVNPVTISVTDDAGRETDSIQATRGMSVTSPGRLAPSDTFLQPSWCRWTHSVYNNSGQLTATQLYFLIPNMGPGVPGTNYDETVYDYDNRGRRNRVVGPTGTITLTGYDVRSLPTEVYVGTNDTVGTSNMKRVLLNVYDNGAVGGNGNLTQARQFVDNDVVANSRATNFKCDFRNRLTDIDGEIDFYQISFYDNLDRVIRVDRHDTAQTGTLIARSDAFYDNRGRIYRTIRYGVNPISGHVDVGLVDNNWFDPSGNVIKTLPAGSQLFTKRQYDGVGRVTGEYRGYYGPGGDESFRDIGQITTDDIIYEQTIPAYDAASNVLMASNYQRFHSASAGGPLAGPSAPPEARVSYEAMWYDGIGRKIAVANYGTNNNAGTPIRPASPPISSDTVLVTRTEFNARGEPFQTSHPAGIGVGGYTVLSVQTRDNAGRIIESIEDAGTGRKNITTRLDYYSGGQIKTLRALNSDTGEQDTVYNYGVTLSSSAIANNDLLASVQYPATSSLVSYQYNRQGQRTVLTDQNNTVHNYDYDKLGRLATDKVITLGSDIDGAVRRISRFYEVRGMISGITSYDAPTGGSAVNDVLLVYNDFQQLASDYQSHSGPVNTAVTPQVQYRYVDGTDNTVRRTQVLYPNSRVINYSYDDPLSRVSQIVFDSAAVDYTYFGLSNFVQALYTQPHAQWNLITGTGANPYAALDRFGRLIDCRWQYTISGLNFVRLEYGYDQANNRIWRQDDFARSISRPFDELYTYDTAQRLASLARGTLNSGHTAVTGATLQQTWTLDSTGNWNSFAQDVTPGTANDFTQTRQHTKSNEIQLITTTVGTPWTTPLYDSAGNAVSFPQPLSPSSAYAAKYDAWNRLMKVNSGLLTVARFTYDGLNRRATQAPDFALGDSSPSTRHFYYGDQWQVLEERVDGFPIVAERQLIWGIRYVDDLVLRDRQVFIPPPPFGSSSSGSETGIVIGEIDPEEIISERLYALQDANWNVVATLDAAAGTMQRFAYTAYGMPQFFDSSFLPDSNFSDWETLFTGQRFDVVNALYLYRNRYYHPLVGSFVVRDLLGYEPQDANLYRYLFNSPTNRLDASGLWDPGGHFWGTYLDLVTVGVKASDAQEIAYWAEYPDEDWKYDATTQGKIVAGGLAASIASEFAGPEVGLPVQTAAEVQRLWSQDVYNWLHSLHGGDRKAVLHRQTCLEKFLSTIVNGPAWQQGVVIHALGDSYAHVDASDHAAWGWPFGHLWASWWRYDPDIINNINPSYNKATLQNYLDYLNALNRAYKRAPVDRNFLNQYFRGSGESSEKEAEALKNHALNLIDKDKQFDPKWWAPGKAADRRIPLKDMRDLITRMKKACD